MVLLFTLLTCFVFSSSAWAASASCPPIEEMRPLLNSERIEACFGSYGVEVLCQDGDLRISNLYSDGDYDKHFTRTLAVTRFREEPPMELGAALGRIREGASIGSTLKAEGWRVDKKGRYIGELTVTSTFGPSSTQADGIAAHVAAVYVYDLRAVRNGEVADFATIAELYDPQYLTLSDLEVIYAAEANAGQPDKVAAHLLGIIATGNCRP
jgi:hypothetical protein